MAMLTIVMVPKKCIAHFWFTVTHYEVSISLVLYSSTSFSNWCSVIRGSFSAPVSLTDWCCCPKYYLPSARSPNCTHPHFSLYCGIFISFDFFFCVCQTLDLFGISLLFVKPPLANNNNVVIIIWHSSVIRGCNLRRYLERGESALYTIYSVYYVVGRMMKNGSVLRGNRRFITI